MSEPETHASCSIPASRRGFLGVTLGLGSLAAVCGIETFWLAPDRLDVTHHSVEIPDLPDHLEGFTVAHLTDLHFGDPRGAHRSALEWIQSHDPDLVVCTGDLVERPADLPVFERFAGELAEASSRIVGVLGNWEHRRGADFTRKLRDGYERAGIPLLANASRTYDDGLVVTGGDDPVTGQFDPEATFSTIPDGEVHLFAVHAPSVFDRSFASAPTFDLSIAGHTHGGQFRLGPWTPVTPRGSGRFVSGWYETDLGDAYVSRGVGMTFVRGRFLCPAELPIFTLRAV